MVCHPPPAHTVSRVESDCSRQLIRDSRALIARGKAFIAQARQSLARQNSCQIVCAWCQQTIRWQHVETATRGQISHSICFACSLLLDSGVFTDQQLDERTQ